MYSLSTLRRKAHNIGYQIHKGYPVIIGAGAGYMVVDEDTNFCVGGADCGFGYEWNVETVEEFLRERYESCGLTW